jgi:hypothetical protein
VLLRQFSNASVLRDVGNFVQNCEERSSLKEVRQNVTESFDGISAQIERTEREMKVKQDNGSYHPGLIKRMDRTVHGTLRRIDDAL